MEGGMSQQLLSRFTLAVVAGFAVMVLAGSAEATNNNNNRRVLVTCPAGQDPNGTTFHTTKIQIRNITGTTNAFVVKTAKVYGPNGTLLKNLPTPDAFPAGFDKDPPAHGGTVLDTEDLFGNQSPSLLTIVLDIQVNVRTLPYLITAVELDLDANTNVASRTTSDCVEQWY
jgi:hypothetical protein